MPEIAIVNSLIVTNGHFRLIIEVAKNRSSGLFTSSPETREVKIHFALNKHYGQKSIALEGKWHLIKLQSHFIPTSNFYKQIEKVKKINQAKSSF